MYTALHNNTDLINPFIATYLKNNPQLLEEACNNNYLYKLKVYGINKNLYISEKSSVSNGFFNTASGKIEIKDYVFFGQNVIVNAAKHDYTKHGLERMKSIPSEGCDIIIEEGVWICSNATIVGPCVIGKNSVVLAGSVVTKNIGDNEMHGGVPAKFIKKI